MASHLPSRLAALPGILVQKPWRFGLAVALLHLLLVAPMLARHHFDPSVLIVAGDRFVAAGQTPSPIIIRPHSDGYDGQFYYRLALAPFLPRAQAFGITLDHPAWRMQRILLPMLVRAVAGLNPALVPASFLAVNLTGIFVIGWLAAGMARARQMPWAVPVAIALWPGLLIALTHDTTEILATALLLAGIAAWLARRWGVCALMLALASLTRETAILVAAGMLALRLYQLARPQGVRRDWQAAAWAFAAVLPFLAWREILLGLWQNAPQAHGVAQNIGWPLLGLMQSLLANLLNYTVGAARAPATRVVRITALLGIGLIVCTGARAFRARRMACQSPEASALMLGWLALLVLMALLTAQGPWVEPTASFRAFTEFWVLSWVLIGLTKLSPKRPSWLFAGMLPALLGIWELCWIQLK